MGRTERKEEEERVKEVMKAEKKEGGRKTLSRPNWWVDRVLQCMCLRRY